MDILQKVFGFQRPVRTTIVPVIPDENVYALVDEKA
jgi:hypothetical protein